MNVLAMMTGRPSSFGAELDRRLTEEQLRLDRAQQDGDHLQVQISSAEIADLLGLALRNDLPYGDALGGRPPTVAA